MSLKKLNQTLKSLKSSYSSGKEKGGKSFWNSILKNFKKVSDIAKSSDWQSIGDACQIGENLVNKISSEEISDDPKIYKHIETLLKIFDDLYNDIQSNGQITISVKGRLSKVKMFIGDFVNIPEETKDTRPAEESGFSIDVMHELNSRVENMEHLVLGINGLHIEPEAINGLFREFHTLKGEAGFIGFENLGKFCHRVETILEPIRNKKVFVTQDIIDILLFCVDKTKLLVLNAQNKEDTGVSDGTDEKLSLLEKFIHEQEDKPAETDTLRQNQGDLTETKAGEKEKEPSSEFAEAFPLDDEDEEDGSSVSSTETAMEQTNKKDIQGTTKNEIEEIKDDIVDAGIKAQQDDQQVFLNVETNKVDSLINITGELTILYHMIQQSPEIRRISNQKITNNIDMMGRFFKELQSITISIRTVSIQSPLLENGTAGASVRKEKQKEYQG